ncbi:MAG: hypothetical protein GWO85_01565 [Simkaniaceae bacterium]|nr:hypothetical protein [Simkaniaceae bacterium]
MAEAAVDTVIQSQSKDNSIVVDTIPKTSEALKPALPNSVQHDSLPELTVQPDTLEPEPDIVSEEAESHVTVDTIPVEWVKSTTRILPQQDTFLVAITDPDTLMALNQYNLAAQYWKLKKRQDPDHFTIVLMYACSGATIDSIKKILPRPNELFILPRDVDNRSCFIVCWGDFRTREAAGKQFESIPGWFAENGLAPMIRPLFKIDRLTRLSLTRLIIDYDHIKRE